MAARSIIAGAVLSGIFLASIWGQDSGPASVRDGIYTLEQAARGERAYRENCASCHGFKLEGRRRTPPLVGSEFTDGWDWMTVADLFEKIQLSMPADRPGQLSDNRNADILAYLLKCNDYPTGHQDLAEFADALRGILFVAGAKSK